MEDFQSKYSGEQVEEMLDQIANGEAGGGGGGITVETDPVFSASPAASITDEKKAEWDNKVDKVSGKRLSTEDFTSALKTKLEGLSNYDDTELLEVLSTLRGDFDALVSGDTTTAIKSFNDIIAFLDGVQDTQDLASIIASIEQQIAGKMDNVTLAKVATSGSYNDLSNKPTIPSAVTESTVSGWGFTKNTGTYSKPSGGIPTSDLDSMTQAVLSDANDDHQRIKDINADIASLYDVKQDNLISGTNIKTINGTSILGSGDITIEGGGDVTKETFDSLVDTVNNLDADVAQLIEDVQNKQDTLESGTNIKTINGQSIVGSGNIEISGGEGGGSSSDGRKEVIYVDMESTITSMRPNVIYWILGLGDISIESFEEPVYGVDTYDVFTAIIEIEYYNDTISLTLPDYVMWANGVNPEIGAGEHELSISRISDGDYAKYYAVLTPFKPL